MELIRSLWKAIVLGLLAVYRRFLSPLKPPSCRFYPSCSAYTAEAVEIHGSLRGLLLGFRRVARCHPWNPGGIDLVPPQSLKMSKISKLEK